MPTNNFKPFGIGSGANVTSQGDYEALAALLTGFTAGKASSAQVNKAIRQATVMASVIAQFIANSSGNDVLDDGNTALILTNFIAAMKANGANDFLQKSNNLSDVMDIVEARSNLELGNAATRKVGVGTNQIPDMNSFTASLSTNGWAKFPNGLIIQWGMAGQLTPSAPDAVGSFNISFPNGCLFMTEHDQGNSAAKSVIQIGYITNVGFTMYNLGVLDRANPSGLHPPTTVTVPWFAIGY